MPSKNIFEDKIRKLGKQKETYLIHKTAISAVAVLLGAGAINASGNAVHADDMSDQTSDQSQVATQQSTQTVDSSTPSQTQDVNNQVETSQTGVNANTATNDQTANNQATEDQTTSNQTANNQVDTSHTSSMQPDSAYSQLGDPQTLMLRVPSDETVKVPNEKPEIDDMDWSFTDKVKTNKHVKEFDTALIEKPLNIELKHRTLLDVVVPPRLDVAIDVNRREPIKSNPLADAGHDFAVSKNKEVVQKPINEKTGSIILPNKEKEALIRKVQAEVDFAPKHETSPAFNVKDWRGVYDNIQREYTIYAFVGKVSDDLYIPRSRDFVKAGKVPTGTKVYMTDALIKQLGLVK